MSDEGRVNVDLVMKLFDTLKESNTNLKYQIDKQNDAINSLGSLSGALQEYIKNSGVKLGEIDQSIKENEKTSGSILNYVKGMSKSVKTMIAVVIIAFSLMSISYLFVRSNIDSLVEKKMNQTDNGNDALKKQIEELRKEIERLHSKP